jgi:hypothetical protein
VARVAERPWLDHPRDRCRTHQHHLGATAEHEFDLLDGLFGIGQRDDRRRDDPVIRPVETPVLVQPQVEACTDAIVASTSCLSASSTPHANVGNMNTVSMPCVSITVTRASRC